MGGTQAKATGLKRNRRSPRLIDNVGRIDRDDLGREGSAEDIIETPRWIFGQ